MEWALNHNIFFHKHNFRTTQPKQWFSTYQPYSSTELWVAANNQVQPWVIYFKIPQAWLMASSKKNIVGSIGRILLGGNIEFPSKKMRWSYFQSIRFVSWLVDCNFQTIRDFTSALRKHNTEAVRVGLGPHLAKQSFTTLVHGSNTSKFQVILEKNAESFKNTLILQQKGFPYIWQFHLLVFSRNV